MIAKIKTQKSKVKMTNQKSNCQSESTEGGRRFSIFPIFKSCNPLIFIFFILQFSFFNLQCEKPTPPPDKPPSVPPIVLTAEDVGVTDAWIKLRAESIEQKEWNIELRRDGQTIFTLSSTLYAHSSSLDTLILDEGLLPKRTYKYKAYRLNNNTVIDSSAELLVPTLDTSSHNFIFQIDTLGEGNSSVLRDVCIINDTLAYAVGEINVKDSLGNWINPPYNMAKWNGREWKLKRILYNYQGVDYYAPLHSVFAFNENDYWVGSNQPMHWDGVKWRTFDLTSSVWNGWINKIWGSNSTNIYIVGNNGELAWYNGSSWRRLELPRGQGGTDVSLLDVWGSPDGSVVWACGYYDDKIGTYLFKYNGIKWEIAYDGTNSRFSIREDSLSGVFTCLYTNNKKYIYIGTNAGVYKCFSDTKGGGKRLSYSLSWFTGIPHFIRGNNINDWFIGGNFNFIAHYNGYSWRYYDEFINYYRHLYSVSLLKNIVVAVGEIYDPIHSRGLVMIGRR